jgi:hypothetical protein
VKTWYAMILLFVTISTKASSGYEAILEEALYLNYSSHIRSAWSQEGGAFAPLTNFQQKLFVDALWDLLDEGDEGAKKILKSNSVFVFSPVERLRVGVLRILSQVESALPEELVVELALLLKTSEPDLRLLYTLAAHEKLLLAAGHQELIGLAQAHPSYQDIQEDETRRRDVTDTLVTDLFNNSPDVSTYMNGEYAKSVKIFMFCRENRIYPCLMIMRNAAGEVVRNSDGSLWAHKALASSARGLPSYTRNGNTPAGILTMDSVMPAADQTISFGKFRRIILNFIPKSKDESLAKSLLPASSRLDDWWRAASVARDIGRNLLRIHGTGKINPDPLTPYYPFMRTSGCIAQRENTYEGVTFADQRVLLDKIMTAMKLVPDFSNEINIKGILYLLDIDNKNSPVELDDLSQRGIQ